jgi:hypothetical protein
MKKSTVKFRTFFFHLAFFYSVILVAQTSFINDALIAPQGELAVPPNPPLALPENGIFRIPVVVHIIHDGGPENITESQIVSAIQDLNDRFRGVLGGADTEIEFFLASKAPNGNCSGGINRVQSPLTIRTAGSDIALKNLSRWPNEKYLNIWVVKCISADSGGSDCLLEPSSGFAIGYSYTPCSVNNYFSNPPTITCNSVASMAQYDGVVIRNDAFGTTETALPKYYGVLAHEIGHWLNLQHIFAPDAQYVPTATTWTNCHLPSEGLVQGDFVSDTPPQDVVTTTANIGCANSINVNTCTLDNLIDDWENIMGYHIDLNNLNIPIACLYKFSLGQKERMRDCLMNIRTFIWSDANLACASYSYGDDYSVKTNTTWSPITLPNNGDITIGNSLTIEPGKTLTISANVTVHFCPNAKLIVKPNARLQLSGTLTGSCGLEWNGVEVWGNGSLSQYPLGGIYAQGRFSGNEGAIIENALTAVQLWGPSYADAGGQITATRMMFRNNHRAVRFAPYSNFWPFQGSQFNQPRSYFGNISGCNFITNNDYILNTFPFFAFIDMVGIKGVTIRGSSFVNDRTITGNSVVNWGYGIYAFDSGFNVLPGCGSISQCDIPNQFTKLGHGVFSSGTVLNKSKPFIIQGSNFNDCFIGIYERFGNGSTIIFNNFNLGKVPSSTFIPISTFLPNTFQEQLGIFLLQDPTFTLEENFFNKVSGTANVVNSIGSMSTNSSMSINTKIRRNTYSNIEYGNFTWGPNSDNLNEIGLHYLCNTNQNNSKNDFLVPPFASIRRTQGESVFTSQGLVTMSAGNKFSYYLGDDDMGSDFTANNAIQYHYTPNTPNTPNTNPIDILGNITKTISLPNECASSYCRPPCKTPAELVAIKSDFFSKKTSFVAAKNQYDTSPSPQGRDLMNYYKGEMLKDAGLVTIHLAYDTATYSQDSLRAWMKNTNTLESDLWLLNDYISSNLTTTANQLLNEIVQKYSLNTTDQNSLVGYWNMLNFLSTKSVYQLSNSDLNVLRGYLLSSNLYTKPIIENILSFYGDYYPPVYELPYLKERDLTQHSQEVQNKIVSVYPNPTTSNVTFKVSPTEKVNIISVKIFDLNGVEVYKSDTLDNTDTVIWQNDKNVVGIYFYHILLDNNSVQSGKISIIN